MKTKKLTKREWYWAALAWDSAGKQESHICAVVDDDFISEAASASAGETGGWNNGNTPDNSYDRWFMYSQYCLECAGVPAGKQ